MTCDNNQFKEKVRETREAIKAMAGEISQEGQAMDAVFATMAKGMAAIGIGMSATQLVKSIASVRSEFQQLEVAFKTMLGSEEKANDLMQQLVKTAAITPFDLQGVTQGAKQLLAYGTASGEVNETLTRLGDIAAGLSLPLGDLVYLYGTTMNQGRMFTMDLRQFMGRGIPIAEELAKQFGTTKDKVGELVTAGRVGAEQFKKAIWSLSDAGGKFGGLMEAQSKTIGGQISNIGDAIDNMLNDIGKESEGVINYALARTSDVIENYKQIGEAIGYIIASYGTYKAVLATVAAVESSMTSLRYGLEAEELEKVLVLKAQYTGDDLSEMVADGKLTQAKAEKIAALRAEATEYLRNLEIKEAAAIAEAKSAQEEFDALDEKREFLEDVIGLAKEEHLEAVKNGDVEGAAAAAAELTALSEEHKALAKELATANTKKEITATNAATLTTQREAVANEVDTAAKTANTKATGMLAVMTGKLKAAMNALTAAMAKNPFILLAIVVAAAATAIYHFATAESASEAALRKHNEALDEFNNKIKERRDRVKELLKIMRDSNETSVAKSEAYNELADLAPNITKQYTQKELSSSSSNIDNDVDKTLNAERDKERIEQLTKSVGEYERVIGSLNKRMKEHHQNQEHDKEQDVLLQIMLYNRQRLESYKLEKAELEKINKLHEQAKKDSLSTADKQEEKRADVYKSQNKYLADRVNLLDEMQKQAPNFEIENEDDVKNSLHALTMLQAEYQRIVDKKQELAYIDTMTRPEKEAYTQTMLDNAQKEYDAADKAFKQAQEDVKSGKAKSIPIEIKANRDSAKEALNDAIDLKNKIINNKSVKESKIYIGLETDQKKNEAEIKKVQTSVESAVSKAEKGFEGLAPDGVHIVPFELQYQVDASKRELDRANSDLNNLAEEAKDENFGKKYRAAQKEYIDAKKAYDAIIANKDKYTQTEYDKAKSDLENAEKSFKGLGGDPSKLSKSKENQQKMADELLAMQRKNAQEAIKQNEDLIEQRRQQIEYDYQVRGDEIKKQEEKLKKANKDAGLGEKLTSDQQSALDESRRLSDSQYQADLKKNAEEQQAAMDSYLKEYGTAEEKRFAITREYARKIYDAKSEGEKLTLQKQMDDEIIALQTNLTEHASYIDKRKAKEIEYDNFIKNLRELRDKEEASGNKSEVEKLDRTIAQAEYDKGKDLMQLDYEQLKLDPDYIKAFENLDNTSTKTLNRLISMFESAKQSASQSLNPDDLKAYTDAIQQMTDALIARNPFTAMIEARKEYHDTESEVDVAQAEYDRLKGNGGVTIGSDGKMTRDMSKETAALDKLNKAKEKQRKANEKVKKSEQAVASIINDLSDNLRSVGDAIGGTAGQILGLIGDIGNFAMVCMTSTKQTAEGASAAVKACEKASVILAIIGAALQIAQKMASLFDNREEEQQKYEDTKKIYQNYIGILDDVISKNLELADSLSMDAASKAFQVAMRLNAEEANNARKMAKRYLSMGASAGSHSYGVRNYKDITREAWAGAAGALGMSISQFQSQVGGRLTGLFDLTSEQLVKIKEQGGALFLAQLHDETRDYIEAIISTAEKQEEIVEENIKNKTRLDKETLTSDFADLLSNMDASSQNFAQKFEDYLKEAVVNGVIKDTYAKRLEDWRKRFSNRMDGGLSEAEYKTLVEEGKQIAEDMIEDQKKMKEMYGWTSESQQEATTRGFEGMSQDTAEELNGRFTALQIAGEDIRGQMLALATGMDNMVSIQTDGNATLQNILNQHVITNSYLEDISRHTKAMTLFGEKLDAIAANTKNI